MTVKLIMALTMLVMSMSPDLVEGARIGAVSRPTTMVLDELEITISVETQIGNPMLGAIP